MAMEHMGESWGSQESTRAQESELLHWGVKYPKFLALTVATLILFPSVTDRKHLR